MFSFWLLFIIFTDSNKALERCMEILTFLVCVCVCARTRMGFLGMFNLFIESWGESTRKRAWRAALCRSRSPSGGEADLDFVSVVLKR